MFFPGYTYINLPSLLFFSLESAGFKNLKKDALDAHMSRSKYDDTLLSGTIYTYIYLPESLMYIDGVGQDYNWRYEKFNLRKIKNIHSPVSQAKTIPKLVSTLRQ